MKAIRGGKILTATNGTIQNGIILVDNGKFIEVGKDIDIPVGTEIIDASDKVIAPGFVEAHSHIASKHNVNELGVPKSISKIEIDFDSPDHRKALADGITTFCVIPGSANPVAGVGIVVKSAGEDLDKRTLQSPSGFKTTGTAYAAYGHFILGFDNYPNYARTKLGLVSTLKKAFIEAQEYIKHRDAGTLKKKPNKVDLEVYNRVEKVLNKELFVRMHCAEEEDLLFAFKLVDEYGIDLIIEHGYEAYKRIDEIVSRKIPVVMGPELGDEWNGLILSDQNSIVKLYKGGVFLAIQTDAWGHCMELRRMTAEAVKFGIPYDEAIKMVTINPAKMLRLDHRIGSIESGKDADFGIYSDDPLKLQTKVEQIYVDGNLAYQDNWK